MPDQENALTDPATLEGHGATFAHVKEGRLLEAEDATREDICERLNQEEHA